MIFYINIYSFSNERISGIANIFALSLPVSGPSRSHPRKVASYNLGKRVP